MLRNLQKSQKWRKTISFLKNLFQFHFDRHESVCIFNSLTDSCKDSTRRNIQMLLHILVHQAISSLNILSEKIGLFYKSFQSAKFSKFLQNLKK